MTMRIESYEPPKLQVKPWKLWKLWSPRPDSIDGRINTLKNGFNISKHKHWRCTLYMNMDHTNALFAWHVWKHTRGTHTHKKNKSRRLRTKLRRGYVFSMYQKHIKIQKPQEAEIFDEQVRGFPKIHILIVESRPHPRRESWRHFQLCHLRKDAPAKGCHETTSI